MFLVGLTGGIGSGKSTVSALLQQKDIALLDLDKYARVVVAKGEKALDQIVQIFGSEILLPDGSLNRAKLGEIIFADEPKRKQLNAIVHPAIYKRLAYDLMINFLKGCQFTVLDIPLLFETKNLLPYMNSTVVVWCQRKQQFDRVRLRNPNLTAENVDSRISSQMSLDEKRKMADYVIMNDGEREKIHLQVENVLDNLRKKKAHWKVRFVFLSAVFFLAYSVASLFNYIYKLYY